MNRLASHWCVILSQTGNLGLKSSVSPNTWSFWHTKDFSHPNIKLASFYSTIYPSSSQRCFPHQDYFRPELFSPLSLTSSRQCHHAKYWFSWVNSPESSSFLFKSTAEKQRLVELDINCVPSELITSEVCACLFVWLHVECVRVC